MKFSVFFFLPFLLLLASCNVAPEISLVNVLPNNSIDFENGGSIFDNVTCTVVKSPGNNGTNSTNILAICDDNSIHGFVQGVEKFSIGPNGIFSTGYAGNGENLSNVPCGSGCGGNGSFIYSSFFDQFLNITSNVTFNTVSFDNAISGSAINIQQIYGGIDFGHNAQFIFRFNDTHNSTVVHDIAQYHHDATLINGAKVNATGYFGDSMHLDGTDQYMLLDNYKGVVNNTVRTVAMWVKPHTLSGTDTLIQYGKSVAGGLMNMQIRDSGKIRMRASGGNIQTEGALTNMVYNHVVFTWEDDGTPDILDGVIYINGILQNLTGSSQVMSTVEFFNVTVGGRTDNSLQFFNGSIDELIMLNYSLSPTEVFALFNITNNNFENGTAAVPPVPIKWTFGTFNDSFALSNNISGPVIMFNDTLTYFAGNISVNSLIVRSPGSVSIFSGVGERFATFSAAAFNSTLLNVTRVVASLDADLTIQNNYDGTTFMSNANDNLNPNSSAVVSASDLLGAGMIIQKYNFNHEIPWLGRVSSFFGDIKMMTTYDDSFTRTGVNRLDFGFYQNIDVGDEFSIRSYQNETIVFGMNNTDIITNRRVVMNETLYIKSDTAHTAIEGHMPLWNNGINWFTNRSNGQTRRFILGAGGSIVLDEHLKVYNDTTLNGSLVLSQFGGVGDAFVCFNSTGGIFRKETAC